MKTVLVPTLYVSDVGKALEFYKKAFGAEERWKITKEDGPVHVAEFMVQDIFIRLHEESAHDRNLTPQSAEGTTVVLGLLCADPDGLAARAVEAGGTLLSAMKDYEYGYRQGTVRDPFGHHWGLEGLHGLTEKPSF